MTNTKQNPAPQTPLGPVRLAVQAEGAAIAAACIFAYAQTGTGWTLFALLILSPDLLMLGYLAGTRIGALSYNIAHSYLGALALGALAWGSNWTLGIALALIWGAHIGLDRAIGYGLKYNTHFKDTHLGRI